MNIAALIPLILEINNSVDFLNLIPNVEEHNLEFVELNIAMQNNKDQYGNTLGHEFDLGELVAELATRGTCRGQLATRGKLVKYFKMYFKNLTELLLYSNFKLKFSCTTRDECNPVHNKNNNNRVLAKQ